jgi:hypothetical protein
LDKSQPHLSPKAGLDYATDLVHQVCTLAGQFNIIEDVRTAFAEAGLADAVQSHDSDALFAWFAEAISFQGISDSVAAGYIERHGIVEAGEVRQGLSSGQLCPKLRSYWHFEGCGYRKGTKTCNEPGRLKRCPLPRHDLRNGSLNQAAYHLYLFIRDVADGDLVSWIDRRLVLAEPGNKAGRIHRLCRAVIEPLSYVHGLSDKVLNMSFANLLMAGDPDRERWVAAGSAMIAVDSLVHNWMWRSGILQELSAEHAYGPACYCPGGCAEIIGLVAGRIDARTFNPGFPRTFPRFVQKAIWHFCAELGQDQCNGRRIDDRMPCEQDCALSDSCQRLALNPS